MTIWSPLITTDPGSTGTNRDEDTLTNTPTPIGTGLDITDAGDAIAALVTDDLTIDSNSTDEGPDAQSVDAISREVLSADNEAPIEATSETDNSDAGDEESEADEDSAETEGNEIEMVTVVVDGKSIEVPKAEVLAGYQRTADYTRKTQALAAERKQLDENRAAFEAEAQAVSQERGHYKALLGQLQQAINQIVPHEPNWDELLVTDQQEYLRQQRIWQTVHQQRQAAEAELQRVQSTEFAEQRQALQSYAQNSAQKLRESIPSWKDETVGRREVEELKQYARTNLGYSDDEINSAVDHRALLAVYKAMKYDALQSGAKNLKPVKAPTLAAGSPSRTVAGSKRSDASKRLARSGSVDDAAAVFASMDL